MSKLPNLANVRHSILGADSNELWRKVDALLEAEWAFLSSVDKKKASLAQVQSLLMESAQSKYLGVGTAWLGNAGVQISTTHSTMSKAGGCRDGAFVILVPAFERLMHAKTGDFIDPKIYQCPRVVMIGKISGKPYPADACDRERIVKAFSEFPASAASFDTSSIASLHYMHLKLDIQKYVSFMDPTRGDSDPSHNGDPYATYHVDSWNYEPMCWMAVAVNEEVLAGLLNAKPSNQSFSFGRLASSDIVLPALPQCPQAPEPELSFDPSHMFRSRVGVLGASGSGKSNLIKNLLLSLKGSKSPWSGNPNSSEANESTVGLLLLDPQGEYAESNRQGLALADLINKNSDKNDPKAHVYSFQESLKADPSRRVLKINFYLEPGKAFSLARSLPSGDSAYIRSAFSSNVPEPLKMLRRFVSLRFAAGSPELGFALSAFDAWVSPGVETFDFKGKVLPIEASNPALYGGLKNAWRAGLAAAQKSGNKQYFAIKVLEELVGLAVAAPLAVAELAKFKDEWSVVLIWWLILNGAGFKPEVDFLTSSIWTSFFAAIGCPQFSLQGNTGISVQRVPPANGYEAEWATALPNADMAFAAHLQLLMTAFENACGFNPKMGATAAALKKIGIANPSSDAKNLGLFLSPNDSRSGPTYIASLRGFHATGFVDAESQLVDFVIAGNTCVVNLADAGQGVSMDFKRQFAERICEKLFQKLQAKFANSPNQDAEPDFNVVLAIEEAQEVLSAKDEGKDTIFKKIALQGRKLGLGVLFATQSPSNIDQNLYKECNMIFCMNLKSTKEIGFLTDQQIDFHSVREKLAAWQKPGLGHWWRSDALILPFMAYEFPAKSVFNDPSAVVAVQKDEKTMSLGSAQSGGAVGYTAGKVTASASGAGSPTLAGKVPAADPSGGAAGAYGPSGPTERAGDSKTVSPSQSSTEG